LRRFLAELNDRIRARQPKPVTEWESSQDLLDALESTVDIIADYTRVAETIAAMGDGESSRALHRAFGPILQQYDLPEAFSGTSYPANFDFIKFIGHELYTTLFAVLIREGRWETMATLLSEGIPVNYSRRDHGPANRPFSDMSEHLVVFTKLNEEKRRVSVHADLLKVRHENDPLRLLTAFDEFIGADYFLYLRGELPGDELGTFIDWRPWSTFYMTRAPRFFLDARDTAVAQKIATALGLDNVQMLKRRLHERAGRLRQLWRSGWWDQPVNESDVERIGAS